MNSARRRSAELGGPALACLAPRSCHFPRHCLSRHFARQIEQTPAVKQSEADVFSAYHRIAYVQGIASRSSNTLNAFNSLLEFECQRLRREFGGKVNTQAPPTCAGTR